MAAGKSAGVYIINGKCLYYETHVIVTITYIRYRCIDVYLTFAYYVMYMCVYAWIIHRYNVIRLTERTFVSSK